MAGLHNLSDIAGIPEQGLPKGNGMARLRKTQSTDGKFYRAAFEWMGIGFEFCMVIGVFAFGGYWLGKLDTKDTSTAGMILGFFIGFGIMMYIMIKRAQRTERELDALEDERDEEDDGQQT